MEITNPDEMAKLAEDVRQQEEPFVRAAAAAFESLFGKEYRRLRACALESGDHVATLNVTVECNFNPAARSIAMQTAPAPRQAKPRREAVQVKPVRPAS